MKFKEKLKYISNRALVLGTVVFGSFIILAVIQLLLAYKGETPWWMAIIITIACLVKIGLIQILIALILVIPIIYSSYYLLAKYYKYKINKKSIKHKNKIKKGTK